MQEYHQQVQDFTPVWMHTDVGIQSSSYYNVLISDYDVKRVGRGLATLFPGKYPESPEKYPTQVTSSIAITKFVSNNWPCGKDELLDR